MSTIACVAPGVSLTQDQVDRLRGRVKVMLVGDAYRLCSWADWLYHADQPWWKYHHESIIAAGFSGELWTSDRATAARYGLNHIRVVNRAGLSLDVGEIHGGSHSGYQAINLAHHFGARRILLVGYDMHGTHFFGKHPEFVADKRTGLRNTAPETFEAFLERYRELSAAANKTGLQIVNCTPASAIKFFPMMSLDQALTKFCTPETVLHEPCFLPA